MSTSEGNPKVRTPFALARFADWLAAQANTHNDVGRRAMSAGRALELLLASHGYISAPAQHDDLARMREIHQIAKKRLEERP